MPANPQAIVQMICSPTPEQRADWDKVSVVLADRLISPLNSSSLRPAGLSEESRTNSTRCKTVRKRLASQLRLAAAPDIIILEPVHIAVDDHYIPGMEGDY